MSNPAVTLQRPGIAGAIKLYGYIVPDLGHRKDPNTLTKQFQDEKANTSSRDQVGDGPKAKDDTADPVEESHIISDLSSDTDEDDESAKVRQKQLEAVKASLKRPKKVSKAELKALVQKGSGLKVNASKPKRKKHNFSLY